MFSEISQKDYLRLKEVLAAAIEISPENRTEFLRRECGDNDKLRLQLEEMLAASDEGGKFLEDFSAVSVFQNSVEAADNYRGRKIDDYVIEKEIGRGGMGIVYLAERSDFHQRAALKLIKRGMDSDAIIERFHRERDILAALNHPYIARLTDGGTTDDDLPFFVMEYVEGLPVDEYCQKNALSEQETLELFRKICEAVRFAHQKLVVHRDLKPSNILVTEDGTPKLLDFGIAKLLTGEANETQTDQRALTPAYASPEQIRGAAVDTTSDVYSLGKILNELLQSSNTSLKAIVTDQNKGRNTSNPGSKLTADLQAVLENALREDTARRYNSVEKFSEDLRRYLHGLPVTARKDTFFYRAAKFIRRNYIQVSATTLVFLLAVAGLTAIIREHNKAERRFNDVRALANSFLFEFHDAIADLPGATPARKLVVERSLEYLNKLDRESSGDASLQRELAAAYEKVGQIQGNSYYSNLGDTAGAMQSYERSLAMRKQLAAADANNYDLQKELADSYEGLGDMFQTTDDLQTSLENYQNSLAVREKIAAVAPENQAYQSALGDIYAKIGDLEGMDGYPNLGDTLAALENYQKAAAVNGRLAAAAPGDFKAQMHLAQRLSNLGSLYRVIGKSADAIDSCQKADSIYRSLVAADPNDFTNKFNMLANNATLRYALVDDKLYDAAVELMNRTIKMLGEMQTADPENMIVRRSLGVSYNALSRTLTAKGDYQRAVENSRQALKIAEGAAGGDTSSTENSADLAATLQFLADAEYRQKNYTDALTEYRRAVDIYRKNLAADSSNARTRDNLSNCLAGIGEIEAAQGDFAEAVKNFNEIIPSIEEAARKSPVNAVLRSRLALRYMEFGEVFEARSASDAERNPENQSNAKEWFNKSAQIWGQMMREGILNKNDAEYYQKVSESLKKYPGV